MDGEKDRSIGLVDHLLEEGINGEADELLE